MGDRSTCNRSRREVAEGWIRDKRKQSNRREAYEVRASGLLNDGEGEGEENF